MKVVYNWLKDFVDVTATPQELASRLALAGTNIASVEPQPLGGVLDAEITSNRPDCLGVYGIAREVSAIYKLPLEPINPKPAESSAARASDAISVKIESPELCGRFTARVIRNVKIQSSPAWLRERLEAAGVASISNVVDATNYVMLELGHPLHAFDYELVRNHSIVVRAAKPGEKLKTLDGTERTLDPSFSVVCDGDGSRAVGIGGIMGGGETEISFSTKNVLIECAWFEPVAIRRATRFLKLHTEASTRFSRCADPEMAEIASRRCAELILELAGGELFSGVVDVYPVKHGAKKITITRAELLRVMGADIPDREIEAILSALGFAPVRVDHNRGQLGSILAAWECTQPSWRADAEREIDLIEEVIRIYGMDKFPPRLPAARQGAARLPHYEAETRLRERLIGLGYREIVTIPQVAEERDALFRPQGMIPARLANPLSEEAGLLRSNGSVSMAGAIEWNLNHGQRNVRLFEIGRHYRFVWPSGERSAAEKDGVPVETTFLTLGATGEARSQGLYNSVRQFSFADLKGDLDAIGALGGGFEWQDGGRDSLHPAKRGRLLLGTNELGSAGQLSRRIADKLKFRQDVFLAELVLGPFYCKYYGVKEARRYEALPRFPSVERDFSLLLADGVTFADVANTIRRLNIPEIASVEAADLFRGKNVSAGKYSLMVRVTFQSREATFTDAQVADFSAKIVTALESRLAATLRAS
ncbi:MAG TPA: phenylalanine--tRNA ligase subunit beta [Candidatus Eisenbacteria bacterium]|nr:phenylalanine--tRNA ligase subunit beta [Candidatus Eisenbacteria bacterium]